MPADASAGDPVLAGRSNSGGGFGTELRANTTRPTFRAVQLGGGNGLRGEATNGRAVVGTAGHDGTGVWAYSPDHFGVRANTDTGWAVAGFAGDVHNSIALAGFAGPNGHALFCGGKSEFDGNVRINLGALTLSSNTPVAPDPDYATLFATTSVSGKVQLAVRFPTGAVQVLSTEP
jgi:hypothetical protein